jgi:hypothetical protein
MNPSYEPRTIAGEPVLTRARRQEAPEALRELPAVEVVVEGLPHARLSDLAAETLRQDIEAVLAASQVRALPRASGGPILYFNVDMLHGKHDDELIAGIEVQLLEDVRREREPNVVVLAATWDDGLVLATDAEDLGYVRDSARTLALRFIDAHRNANLPRTPDASV